MAKFIENKFIFMFYLLLVVMVLLLVGRVNKLDSKGDYFKYSSDIVMNLK